MKPQDATAAPGGLSHAHHRRRLAQRVADAHRVFDDGTLLALVSGSVVEDLADARSDIDMSVVLATLPDEAALQAACQRAGGTAWFWQTGQLHEGGLVVAFRLEGIEVQIGYASQATLNDQLDELLLRHNPDTPLHKLGEGLLKAEPLVGAERLAALKARLAAFPPGLAQAMLAFWLKTPMPWRAVSQILHRDATLWCHEILVEACWRQLGQLAALNSRYFTRFQLKRMHKLAASFAIAPPALAERIDALLQAPPRAAFDALHRLEGEVLALVAQHAPATDLKAPLARRADYQPD
jgi:hypothetical protein